MKKPAPHLTEPKPTTAGSLTLGGPTATDLPRPSSSPVAPPQPTTAPPNVPAPGGGGGQPGKGDLPAGGDGDDQGDSPPDEPGESEPGTGGTGSGASDPGWPFPPFTAILPPVVVVGGTATLTPGSPATTIAGHVISFAPGSPCLGSGSGSGSAPDSQPSQAPTPSDPTIIIDSISIPLRSLPSSLVTGPPALRTLITPLTPTPDTFPPHPVPALIVGTRTLLAGSGPMTVGNGVMALISDPGRPDAVAVVMDGRTMALEEVERAVATGMSDLRALVVRTTRVVGAAGAGTTEAAVRG
ncbi:Choline transport protein [Sphaceloma murrayae]|uniref:Choline transport protein n=1 Tax=Sphaceloma murrayae TaxID=2082308 RepID=A0A2K1QLX1_9PEZI|nr:Choline transport protein [Sphaceloma murrayae]